MPSFCQPLLGYGRTGRVSRIVRGAQQAPPADPSEQGVLQLAAQPVAAMWRATASSANSNNPSGDTFLAAAFPRHDGGAEQ